MSVVSRFLSLGLCLLMLSGCQSAYYSAMEQVGVHKRDILVDRVESARDAQEDAREQFRDALSEFRALVKFDGGELADLYDSLQEKYDDSEAAAEAVTDRIDGVQSVAEALFEEWQQETDLYTNTNLRQQSLMQLKETRQRYKELLRALRKAEQKMQPVLATLRDNVLYLKHNLNARAIGALKGELGNVQRQVDALIGDMEKAISQSDLFIKEMRVNS